MKRAAVQTTAVLWPCTLLLFPAVHVSSEQHSSSNSTQQLRVAQQ